MTRKGESQARWTEAEIAIARSDMPLQDIVAMLPGRTYKAICGRRLGLVQRQDMSLRGRLSGLARRLISTEMKNRFISAVAAGALITKTGLISRSTHLAWKRSDPTFFEWLKSFKERRSEERAEARRRRLAATRKSRAKPTPAPQATPEEMLRNCDVYETARIAIGPVNPQFVREEAISDMVLDLLEGVLEPAEAKAKARRYISRARAQVSYVSANAPMGKDGRTLLDIHADETAEDAFA